MTTDITELALLVSKAKASVFTLEYISQFEPADIDSDDVDLRFEVDGRDTGTNVSIVDECGQAARVIVAQVEALEKAQQYSKERDAENQDLMLTVGRLRVEREELESRTVKLPEAFYPDGDIDCPLAVNVDDVKDVLTAAGIKWEAE
ncbi:TPA: ead/Ea22-like family protein [Raoultella ornithinolytica]